MTVASRVQDELNGRWCHWSKNKVNVFGGI